jgi:4-amino-4-deoxy-L-arabinose transferase-like glycosyltransferase
MAVAAVYLFGNGRTQLFDRDEPRYAQCSRQMLQSGDWVVPRLYDNIRAAKPPGIYWCQATAMTLLGDTPFAARLPSAIAGVLTALLLGIAIWREVGSRHAIWTVFVLATSALMIWSSKICLTDSVLLLCTTVALLGIYVLWRGRGGWIAVVIVSVAIACGGLIKGPFILGVLAATMTMLWLLRQLDRWVDRRREVRTQRGFEVIVESAGQAPMNGASPASIAVEPAVQLTSAPQLAQILIRSLVGLLIVAALISPWLFLVHHRAPQFLGAAREDALHHLESGSEGHKGPPGYHLLLIWATFLPWSLLLPLSIVLAFSHRRLPQVRFALAAVLGSWIFAEILQTKLPHYILSAFPALAFLTADTIVRCLNGEQRDLMSREIKTGAVILAIAVVGAATYPWWWLAFKFHDFPWFALMSLSLFGIVVAGAVCFLFLKARPLPALVSMGLGSLGLWAILFGLYLPRSQPLRLPIRVADVLKKYDAVHPHEAVMFEYKEPSLAFYQGGTIREYDLSLGQLAQPGSAPRWVVTKKTIWDQATPDVRAAFDVIGPPIRGLDYSDALNTVEVMILRKK